jgi:hypothetical protein
MDSDKTEQYISHIGQLEILLGEETKQIMNELSSNTLTDAEKTAKTMKLVQNQAMLGVLLETKLKARQEAEEREDCLTHQIKKSECRKLKKDCVQ